MSATEPMPPERIRIAAQPVTRGWFRDSCAAFWLSTMFFLSRHAPWLVRLLRGVSLRGAWAFSRHLREVTIINARHLLGADSTMQQRLDLGRRIVGSFFDFIYDIGRTSGMSKAELESQIVAIHGREGYSAVRQQQRGAIIATAHIGSFEFGMTGMFAVEKNIHVVFQRDANPLFEALRTQFRQRMGIMEAAVDDGVATWMKLREALQADHVVAMQADRAMPGQIGVKLPFLDGHAFFPEGPAKLAAISGAPIIPVFCVRLSDGRVELFIEQAIEVEGASPVAISAAIAKLAEVVGRYVRRYPDQWLVVQRAWCEDIAACL